MSRGHHRRNYYRPEINGAVKHRCNKENKADFDKFRRLERKSAHINGQLGAEAWYFREHRPPAEEKDRLSRKPKESSASCHVLSMINGISIVTTAATAAITNCLTAHVKGNSGQHNKTDTQEHAGVIQKQS